MNDGEDFVFVDINPAAERHSKVRREEVLGRRVTEVFPAVTDLGLFEVFQEVHRTGETRHLPLRFYHDGRVSQWVENTVYRLPGGQIVAVYEDTSQQHLAEAEVRASEARHRRILEAIGAGYWLVDRDARIQEANDTAAAMLGYDMAEFLGLSIADLDAALSPEDILQRVRRFAGWPPTSFETVHRRKDGGSIDVEITTAALPDDPNRFVVFTRDISSRKDVERAHLHLETQLRHAQKMEAVGRLAGGIAHDFNNLLTAIRSNAELALADHIGDDGLQTELREITVAADRGRDLVRQLLAFGRKQIIAPRVVAPGTLFEGLDNLLARLLGESIRARWSVNAPAWNVYADPGQIEQVLINLAINARDAMPDGGRLEITTENLDLDETAARFLGLPAPGRYLRISVTDSGTGMHEEIRSRIFEPFFTTKDEESGTGLGLATAFAIIQQHHGTIAVDSAPGRGSTFDIFLPASEEDEVAATSPTKTSAAPSNPTGLILLVEDDDLVRSSVHRLLTRRGLTIRTASSAENALQLIDEEDLQIELLLSDVMMPGMNGPELGEHLRRRFPGLRVLLTSGYSEDMIVRGELGDDFEFIPKPYSMADLLGKIRTMLAPRCPGDGDGNQ